MSAVPTSLSSRHPQSSGVAKFSGIAYGGGLQIRDENNRQLEVKLFADSEVVDERGRELKDRHRPRLCSALTRVDLNRALLVMQAMSWGLVQKSTGYSLAVKEVAEVHARSQKENEKKIKDLERQIVVFKALAGIPRAPGHQIEAEVAAQVPLVGGRAYSARAAGSGSLGNLASSIRSAPVTPRPPDDPVPSAAMQIAASKQLSARASLAAHTASSPRRPRSQAGHQTENWQRPSTPRIKSARLPPRAAAQPPPRPNSTTVAAAATIPPSGAAMFSPRAGVAVLDGAAVPGQAPTALPQSPLHRTFPSPAATGTSQISSITTSGPKLPSEKPKPTPPLMPASSSTSSHFAVQGASAGLNTLSEVSTKCSLQIEADRKTLDDNRKEIQRMKVALADAAKWQS
ncbi:hypothetical protein CYMTET_17586 [Cymbomonas tetramitiformis]|uniref:Uncharacterized protein n=1 Tax=Cymbomonas tetramitiformis TaxID=36881 RepID=A0AAE0G9T6_9CHLO|nr:hypothetical protein CYMTET_17586 [Cymbomonas tetramitiformis]